MYGVFYTKILTFFLCNFRPDEFFLPWINKDWFDFNCIVLLVFFFINEHYDSVSYLCIQATTWEGKLKLPKFRNAFFGGNFCYYKYTL